MFAINLGGEGEIPGVINQQGPWALSPNWRCSRDGRTLQQLVADGHVFVICPNVPLPFPDNSVDLVYTNSVPVDMNSILGPGAILGDQAYPEAGRTVDPRRGTRMDQAVTFTDLRSSDPQAAAALKDRVRQSALAWFSDRPETNGTGRRLVIGVAVWSIYDLRLISLVNEAVASGKTPDLHVAVFNIDELASPAELQRLFPGIGEVYQPPAVGYWEAGQLKETASGFAARQLVGRLLGLDPKLVLEQPAATVG